MELEIKDRLEAVCNKLDLGWDDSKPLAWSHVGDRHRSENKTLKKWKYAAKRVKKYQGSVNGRGNRFLPEKLQNMSSLYVNVVDIASERFHGVHIHDVSELLRRCERIHEGTSGVFLDWDAKWINPLTLASKGWDFSGIEPDNELVCRCQCCNKSMCIDLKPGVHSTQSHHETYWVKYVSALHADGCPWRNNQFELQNEYYLQESNLICDISRIHKSILEKSNETELSDGSIFLRREQMDLLKHFFRYDNGKNLEYMLRGYEAAESASGIVKCTKCFRMAFLDNLSNDAQLNYHATWCRYHQEKKLSSMILTLLQKHTQGGTNNLDHVTQRLCSLEKYLEEI